MKNSTKRSSSSKEAPKKKAVPKTLTGLIFWPKVKPEENFFISVLAWVEAGKPDNAIIYDALDNLIGCNIPICDATFFRGLYQRLPKVKKPKPTEVYLHDLLVVPAHPPEAHNTVKGIQSSDKKDHHKLNYN